MRCCQLDSFKGRRLRRRANVKIQDLAPSRAQEYVVDELDVYHSTVANCFRAECQESKLDLVSVESFV